MNFQTHGLPLVCFFVKCGSLKQIFRCAFNSVQVVSVCIYNLIESNIWGSLAIALTVEREVVQKKKKSLLIQSFPL